MRACGGRESASCRQRPALNLWVIENAKQTTPHKRMADTTFLMSTPMAQYNKSFCAAFFKKRLLSRYLALITISIRFGWFEAIPSSTAPAISVARVTRRAGMPIAAASARKSIGGSVMSIAMNRLARAPR